MPGYSGPHHHHHHLPAQHQHQHQVLRAAPVLAVSGSGYRPQLLTGPRPPAPGPAAAYPPGPGLTVPPPPAATYSITGGPPTGQVSTAGRRLTAGSSAKIDVFMMC